MKAESFRLLHQVSRPSQCQQCVRVRNVGSSAEKEIPRRTRLHVGARRKEQLGLYHNELNYMQSCWTAGYVIGQIPSNIILTRVRPSLWIPSMEVHPQRKGDDGCITKTTDTVEQVLWTVLTFCLCRCTTARQVYAVRFFVGK